MHLWSSATRAPSRPRRPRDRLHHRAQPDRRPRAHQRRLGASPASTWASRRTASTRPGAHDPAPFTAAVEQLAAYFAGERESFDLDLAPTGTPFQLAVWEALRTIPYGETSSYGELAAQIGRPGASRAVGAANGNNPLSIVVPCHRVIGADGSLTGFGGGLPAQAVAALDGARPVPDAVVRRRAYRVSVTDAPLTAVESSLLLRIRESVIGDDQVMHGPYGPRRVTYADYTASGRVADVHRGLHPRRGAAALRQHAHRVQRHRPADDPAARGRPAHHPRRHRWRTTRRSSSSAAPARPAAIDKLIGILNLRIPADLDERYALLVAHPGRGATGRVHRAVRAPLQRAALAGVDRDVVTIPEDRDGHIDMAVARAAARRLRRPAAADRVVLGGVQRHRHRHRHPPDRRPAAPARRAVVLGLRRGRAVRRHRDDPRLRRAPAVPQGRGLPVPAQVHRRARHARRARRTT